VDVISIDPGVNQTGLYLYRGGGRSFCVRRAHDERPYFYLVWLRRSVMEVAAGMDLAIVEDYPYTMPGSQSASAIEVGAVVREALAEVDVPIVTVAISLWKSLTIGIKPKKGGVALNHQYLAVIRDQYGVDFATTDEADAFLMYQAALRVWKEGGRTDAQRNLRARIAAVVKEKETA